MGFIVSAWLPGGQSGRTPVTFSPSVRTAETSRG